MATGMERLEAGAGVNPTTDFALMNERSLLSIAISLKRIADQLAGVPYDHKPGADNSNNRMGLVDGIMHAIEQGLIAASHRR